MFVGNLEAKLIPCVLVRLCRDSIKGSHCGICFPTSCTLSNSSAGPLGRCRQGQKRGADVAGGNQELCPGCGQDGKEDKRQKMFITDREERTSFEMMVPGPGWSSVKGCVPRTQHRGDRYVSKVRPPELSISPVMLTFTIHNSAERFKLQPFLVSQRRSKAENTNCEEGLRPKQACLPFHSLCELTSKQREMSI